MRAYSELCLDNATKCLAEAFQFAVVGLGRDADEFFESFVATGVAAAFGVGNPRYVAGMTGWEMVSEIELLATGSRLDRDTLAQAAAYPQQFGEWYWVGFALAYYQWNSGLTFAEMGRCGIAPSVVEPMRTIYGTDLQGFVDRIDVLVKKAMHEGRTNLQSVRRARGLTQKELAEAADVAVRMVQLYEQRQNDINKASAATVARLAHALGCAVEDILECPCSDVADEDYVQLSIPQQRIRHILRG